MSHQVKLLITTVFFFVCLFFGLGRALRMRTGRRRAKGSDWRCSHSGLRLCQHAHPLPPGWLWREFSNISKPSQLANATAPRRHSLLLLLHRRVALPPLSSPLGDTQPVWHSRLIATICAPDEHISSAHSALSVRDILVIRAEAVPFFFFFFSPHANNIINLMRSQQAVSYHLINWCLFQRRRRLQIASADCWCQGESRRIRLLTNF